MDDARVHPTRSASRHNSLKFISKDHHWHSRFQAGPMKIVGMLDVCTYIIHTRSTYIRAMTWQYWGIIDRQSRLGGTLELNPPSRPPADSFTYSPHHPLWYRIINTYHQLPSIIHPPLHLFDLTILPLPPVFDRITTELKPHRSLPDHGHQTPPYATP